MLREEFARGGIVVDNSPEVIAAAVRTVLASRDRFKQEVEELRAQKEHRWQRNKDVLMSKIGLSSQVHARA
jgi:DNA-binding NarL/FixJ family response regulator